MRDVRRRTKRNIRSFEGFVRQDGHIICVDVRHAVSLVVALLLFLQIGVFAIGEPV